MRIVAVASVKGGVGKTTLARALGDYLTEVGQRVVWVDADPQGTLTSDLGLRGILPPDDTLYGVLAGSTPVADAVHELDRGAVVPASPVLQDVDAVLPRGKARLTALYSVLRRLRGADVVVVDTPPTMGTMAWGSMVASDFVVVPTVADLYSVQTLQSFGRTFGVVQGYNPDMAIAGIVVNRWHARNSVDRTYLPQIETIAHALGTEVLGTIRASVAVSQCQACGQSFLTDRPGHPQAVDMRNVCAKISNKIGV